ncbi:MAG: FxsA family protein [Bacteroidota bacterium]
MRLLLLFVVVPLVELVLLIELGERIGFLNTVLLVFATGILGSSLARSQGLKLFRDVQTQLGAGRSPNDALIDGLIILVCGALLLTPGVLTDVFGLLGLFPLTRPFYRTIIRDQLAKRIKAGSIRMSPFGAQFGAGFDAAGGTGSPFGANPYEAAGSKRTSTVHPSGGTSKTTPDAQPFEEIEDVEIISETRKPSGT